MTDFKKGDLIVVNQPNQGGTIEIYEANTSGVFIVRDGHLGIVLEPPIRVGASEEYLEVHFQLRGKTGMIPSAKVRLANE